MRDSLRLPLTWTTRLTNTGVNLVVYIEESAHDRLNRRPAVAGVTHHRAEVNGTTLHYVSAGDTGSPILLVHG